MTQSKPSPPLSADQLQSWLDAYQDNQRQIIQAHQDYQRALKEGLDSFLETMAHTQAQLARVMQHFGVETQPDQTTAPQPAPPAPPAPAKPVAPKAKPTPAATPTPKVTATATDMADELLQTVADKTGYPKEMLELDMTLEEDLGIDSIKRVEILSALRDRHPHLPEVDAHTMASISTLEDVLNTLAQSIEPQPTSNGHGEGINAQDLEEVLLDTVAQKTGYPKEMLELDMTLEEDLGIDSIKRVEILSALRDKAPHLPEVNADHMAQLRTLGDIVSFMRETSSAIAAPNFF